MVFVKFLQGAVTSLIPPGLNSITQGIVGAVGMTEQVSMNEMMNHLGTAIIVMTGSLLGFFLYPGLGMLFVVSPIACVGVLYFISQIRPEDIDHNAARGLTLETDEGKNNNNNNTAEISVGIADSTYKPPTATTPGEKNNIQTQPSFMFGFGGGQSVTGDSTSDKLRADTPLQVLRDPILLVFTMVVFLFHTANGTVLPLVMQSLAIGNGRSGILMSGLCIIVAQLVMVISARVCGKYSGIYGRKTLFLVGFFSVPVRCFILTLLVHWRDSQFDDDGTPLYVQLLILSTQVLDGVGAGVFGTMYILVTSDVSGGTGRFSLTLGITTAAMSIGGTVSGYLGEALAQDLGYKEAFFILMFLSLIPALLYFFCMPETLPALANKRGSAAAANMTSIREEDPVKQTTPSGAPYVEMT